MRGRFTDVSKHDHMNLETTMTIFPKPTYYLAALGLPTDFDKVTAAT